MTIEKIKRFSGASLLLFASVFAAAAQSGGKPSATTDAAPTLFQIQTDAAKPLTMGEAIDLASKQISSVSAAQINERIAAEDVRQARAAFRPRIGVAPNFIFNLISRRNQFGRFQFR